MSEFSAIGQPTLLRDGRAKVLGATRYTPDFSLPGMLHARFVVSQYPHARITSIDIEEAMDLPGVVAVLTSHDLPDLPPTNRTRLLLARNRVMFMGQPIALILADSPAAAQDAVDLVLVEYEPLPAVTTLDAAMAEDAPLVWPGGSPGDAEDAAAHGADVGGEHEDATSDKPSNVADRMQFTRGEGAEGFNAADVIVSHTVTTPMVTHSSLEPHATVVQFDPITGGAEVWTSTQAPFVVRQGVSEALDVPESDVTVKAMPVGGAFGGKFMLYEPLVALAAKHAGRPVSLVLTRGEEMLTGTPSQGLKIEARLGVRKDGTFVAFEGKVLIDTGCYPSSMGGLASVLLASQYRFEHLNIETTEVMTFKASATAYRAPCAPQVTFALESLVDEAARQLQRDPLELRLQNIAQPGDPMVSGKEWPVIGAQAVLEALQAHPAWKNRAEAQEAGRGVGIAIGGWPGGLEPSAATCGLNRDGVIQVNIGAVDLNGTATGFALLAADVFGVPPEKVRVVAGDTSVAPYAGSAGGSKITYTVGPAIIQAVEDAKQQALAIAADMLEAAVDDLEIVDGAVQVRGVPDQAIPLGKIARQGMQFGGRYKPVLGNGRHVETRQGPGFCAQLAEVEVDAETGHVTVHRLAVVQDVGLAINPDGIRGQMMGGSTQGLGFALYEQVAHSPEGQLLTASWMDYNLPHMVQAAHQFDLEIVEQPSEHGPLGARGVGEPPIIPTAAAVANAIADAVGVRLGDLPMTPPRVQAAIEAAAKN